MRPKVLAVGGATTRPLLPLRPLLPAGVHLRRRAKRQPQPIGLLQHRPLYHRLVAVAAGESPPPSPEPPSSPPPDAAGPVLEPSSPSSSSSSSPATAGSTPQRPPNPLRAPGRTASQPRWLTAARRWVHQTWDWLWYNYYNSRSPTTDLRLIAFIYASVMLTLAAVQHYVLDAPGISFTADLYRVRATYRSATNRVAQLLC